MIYSYLKEESSWNTVAGIVGIAPGFRYFIPALVIISQGSKWFEQTIAFFGIECSSNPRIDSHIFLISGFTGNL